MRNTVNEQKAIIASLLLRSGYYIDIADTINPVMFHEPLDRVAAEIWKRSSAQRPYDITTIITQSRVDASVIDDLISFAVTDSSILKEHSYRIRDGFLADKDSDLMRAAIGKLGAGEEYWETVHTLKSERDILRESYYFQKSDRSAGVLQAIHELLDMPPSGIPTGYNELDKFLIGWQGGKLIAIGARPNMGKTSLALQFALDAARAGYPSLILSGEMKEIELHKRLGCLIAGVRYSLAARNQIDESQKKAIRRAGEELYEIPVHIMEPGKVGRNIGSIRDKIRQYCQQEGVRLAMIDYLQLFEGNGKQESRRVSIGAVSRGLKQAALENDITIIALSQLSRAVETRGGHKAPLLGDFKETGDIEQDVDIAFGYHRPERYGIDEDLEGNSLKGIGELNCLKHRDFGDDLPWGMRIKYKDGRFIDADENLLPEVPEPVTAGWETNIKPNGNDEDVPF